jgi:hypothetical protein
MSIHIDGLGVVFGIVFPSALLILATLIIAVVKGVKNRKTYHKWYYKCILIFGIGLFLFSPLLSASRKIVERNVRMSSRELVVEDLKSGLLTFSQGQVIIPFKKYGRVTFYRSKINNVYIDNVVTGHYSSESGLNVTFITSRGFFGNKTSIYYIEKTESFSKQNQSAIEIKPHWYIGKKTSSLF